MKVEARSFQHDDRPKRMIIQRSKSARELANPAALCAMAQAKETVTRGKLPRSASLVDAGCLEGGPVAWGMES